MPMIELFAPKGALPAETLAPLSAEMKDILLRWEKSPDTPHAQLVAWTYVFEVEPALMTVGGKTPDEPRYRVKVTVPDGTLNDDEKASLIRELTQAVLAAEGATLTDEDGLRVWVIIREVRDGSWGVAGRQFRLGDIARWVHKGKLKPLEAPVEAPRAPETVA